MAGATGRRQEPEGRIVKIAELALYVIVAAALGLLLCAVYLPGLAIARIARRVVDRVEHPEARPPLHVRHR